jgi:hypothetical protein
MTLSLSRPLYQNKPIQTLDSLALALHSDKAELERISKIANRSYRKVPPEVGSTREIFNAKPDLKALHKKIKTEILQRVQFPAYLTGSIKGRDYLTNARLHANKKILICEDVTRFFPSVRAEKVKRVWTHFFNFSDEVATLLTKLTTKDGSLPQGAITSSYLANLVLWEHEPLIQAKLREHGITYSRYVDDIAMSSKKFLTKEDQSWLIAQVYGMLAKNGLEAKRKKHEVTDDSGRMRVTKVIVNRGPAWDKTKQSALRTQVFEVEQLVHSGNLDVHLSMMLDRTANMVGQFGRFDKRNAFKLKTRLKQARQSIQAQGGFRHRTGTKLTTSNESNTEDSDLF